MQLDADERRRDLPITLSPALACDDLHVSRCPTPWYLYLGSLVRVAPCRLRLLYLSMKSNRTKVGKATGNT